MGIGEQVEGERNRICLDEMKRALKEMGLSRWEEERVKFFEEKGLKGNRKDGKKEERRGNNNGGISKGRTKMTKGREMERYKGIKIQ